jgi:nitroreductase
MKAIEAIMTRRAVRKFDSSKSISKEKLDVLLKAAMSAPSARNEQPWHFLVVTERELLKQILEVHPYAAMCLEAAAAIIPCVDRTVNQEDLDFWVEDMSAATQNIMLAARAEGLGSVWVGVYPNLDRVAAIKKLFNLPDKFMPFCLIPVGYSAVEQKESSGRFKPDRIHFNNW